MIETGSSLEYSLKFEDFKDKHKGQPGFVAGNGPSLNLIDMAQLKDQVVFGSNRCYLGFGKWGFAFPYWGVEDIAVGGWQAEEWGGMASRMIRFVPEDMLHMVSDPTNVCPLNFVRARYDNDGYPNFSFDPKTLYWGSTVTYMLLQLAVIMGCNPIYLIGVDFHFVQTNTTEDGSLWHQKGPDQNHFCEDYIPNGKFLHHPRLDLQERSFEVARKESEKRGIKVWNASPGSKLQVFDHFDPSKGFPLQTGG